MEVSTHGRAGFVTQADALFRKSLIYQKRNKSQNCCLLITPLVIVGFFALLESLLKDFSDQGGGKVGSMIMEIKEPTPWPPALNIPSNTTRAVRSKYMPFSDLPSPSCRDSGNCPVTFLLTGTNQSLAMSAAEFFFPPVSIENPFDMERLVLATSVPYYQANYLVDPAFDPNSISPLYYLQSKCKSNSSIPFPTGTELKCLEALHLWRNSSAEINREIYKGSGANKQNKDNNRFAAAFDFLNTNGANFNVTLWNRPSLGAEIVVEANFSRLPRLVNMASNAYLQVLQGSDTQMLFEFIKEVPTHFTVLAKTSMLIDLLMRLTIFGLLIFPVTVV